MIKETSDLGFVAALATLGYRGDIMIKGQQAFFNYEWDENMDALEHDYFNNQLEVDARSYNKNLRIIKKVIVTTIKDNNA